MRALAIAAVLLAPGIAAADDHRPAEWMFRATPGFGYSYSWSGRLTCAAQGMDMTGGWYIGKVVTPSVVVGGGLGIDMVGGSPSTCFADEQLLVFSVTLGPYVEWYPLDRGLHVRALAGASSLDQDSGMLMRPTAFGVGGTAALGYDWTWYDAKHGWHDRVGVELEVSVVAAGSRTMVSPALTMTIGVD